MAKKNSVRNCVRNKEVAQGINAFGRSAARARRGVWAIKKKTKTAKAPVAERTNMVGRWYDADDKPFALPSRKSNHKQTRLKAGLTAGAVVIILSGRFKGKRAVFLKQLDSGLLLVTGPYKVNGIPLRRVNQAYVIVTSTKVDASKVDVAAVDDAFFAAASTSTKKDGADFFKVSKTKSDVSAARKAAQKKTDASLLAALKATPLMSAYLNSKFSLKRGQAPHQMKF
jgi:large subunit ribosomal protein L6e